MKVRLSAKLLLAGMFLVFASGVFAASATVNGVTWTYTVANGAASIGGGSINSLAVARSKSGVVTIPSVLGGYPVKGMGDYAFYECSNLTGVTIPDCVTNIGYRAFERCSSLNNVSIGAGVNVIGDRAFYSCNSLTAVTIPDSVTSIGEYAFHVCSNLKSVSLGRGVRSVGDYAFYYPQITTLVAHYGITNVGAYAFGGCDESVFDVTTIPGVKLIGGCAIGYTNTIPASLNLTGACGIAYGAFSNCSELRDVYIPDTVLGVGKLAFRNCSELLSFEVDSGNPRYKSESGLLLTKDGETLVAVPSGLTDVTIPAGVKRIEASALNGCSVMNNINLPDGLTSIGEAAFNGCSSLTNIVIPNGVVSIEKSTFSGCRGLASVTIPNSVTNIASSAFSSCTNLTSVTIPEGVKSVDWHVFPSCYNLINVSLPSTLKAIDCSCLFDRTKIRHLAMFGGLSLRGSTNSCNIGLLEIEAGDGTTSFDTSFFAKAALLKPQVEVLILPSTVTNVEVAAINQLVNLTKIIFKGASRSALSESDMQYLISSGLEIVFEDDGSGGGGETEPQTPKLPTERMVRIVSSGMRADNPNIFDVVYVVSNMTETVNVRLLAFKDGVRSFANVLRPATLIDGTEADVGANVPANVEHTVSWNVAEDWNIDLGRVSVEVLTLENSTIPLKLMTIPRTTSHASLRFSYNALTSAKLLDALFWHYASPDSNLSLSDGVLTSGETILATGEDVTEAGARYVLEAQGYRLLEGDELDYVKRVSRLDLVPSGVRQYGIETLED